MQNNPDAQLSKHSELSIRSDKIKGFLLSANANNKLFDGLFVNRGTTVFLKVQLFMIFFCIKIAKIWVFGFSKKFFASATMNFVIVPVCQIFLSYPKSCSFSIIKGVLFAWSYLFLVGACLLKMLKRVFEKT